MHSQQSYRSRFNTITLYQSINHDLQKYSENETASASRTRLYTQQKTFQDPRKLCNAASIWNGNPSSHDNRKPEHRDSTKPAYLVLLDPGEQSPVSINQNGVNCKNGQGVITKHENVLSTRIETSPCRSESPAHYTPLHSQEPFPVIHESTASDTSIEAWLQRTEAAKTQSCLNKAHKHKRRLERLESPHKTFSNPQPSTNLPASFDLRPAIKHSIGKILSSTSTFTSSTSTQTLAVTSVTSNKSPQIASRIQKKRKRSPSPPTSPRVDPPLTEKALKRYLERMDSAEPNHNEDHLDTNSSTKSSSTANTTNSLDIRIQMELHGMNLNRGKLHEESCSDFKVKVMAIIETGRGSAMKPGSVKKLHKTVLAAMFDNEDALLMKILPLIIKQDRSTSQKDSNNPGEEKWTNQDYEESNLRVVPNREFRRDCLPNAFSAIGYEKEIAHTLAKKQGVKNPKPDRVYGLDVEAWPAPMGKVICPSTRDLLHVVFTIVHSFFIIEGKASKGDMTRATLQTLRGTTALVHSQRSVLISTNQLAKDGGDLGPDDQTFVYSSTVDGSVMDFWVTFACVEKTSDGKKHTRYYMERLTTQAYYSGDEGPTIMRKICHNILDWGVGKERQEMLKKRYEAIYAFDSAWMAEDAKRRKSYQKQGSPSKKQKKGNVGSSDTASSTGNALGALA